MKSEIAACSLALHFFGRRYPGKYILTEGLVASGKSTLSLKLYGDGGVLVTDDYRPVHEPGTTGLAEGVRNLVQGGQSEEEEIRQGLTPLASYLLYSAARASLFDRTILPGLRSGQGYFSDRGWPSSWAYQGAEGVPLWFIFMTSMQITGWLIPNLILYVDIPVELALERRIPKEDLDRYDKRDAAFFRRVRYNYGTLSQVFMGMGIWEKIDGTKPVEEVVAYAVDALKKRRLVK